MEKGRILIVDDCQTNVDVLQELLQEEYKLATATSGEQCLSGIQSFDPDLILLDIMMPGLGGYDVCRRIKQSPVADFTQIILLSGKASTAERLEGYRAGADDYVVKPFDHEELLAKVRIQFRLRRTMTDLWAANARIQRFNMELEDLVRERTAEVVAAKDAILATQDITVFALAKLADSRDTETGEHLERMRTYCQLLAERLEHDSPYAETIDQDFLDDLFRSSPLHDIGKVGITDAILLKPGRLTDEEFDTMKEHTTIGAEALKQSMASHKCGSFLNMAIDVARHHHERFDGTGYPDGLAGHEIPLAARIAALGDVYDALTSARVYKEAFDPSLSRKMIEEGSGTQFDPVIVEAFLDQQDAFLEVPQTGTLLATV